MVHSFLAGLIIGITNIVPGISGGTMGVVLGVYDRLIDLLSHFKERIKKEWTFALPFLIGLLLGLVAFANFMQYMLTQHAKLTFFFIIGVVLGTLPDLTMRTIRPTFSIKLLLPFAVGLGVMIAMNVISPDNNTSAWITTLNLQSFFIMFLGGFLAAACMIIPGVSGSFAMLLLGIYPSMIKALTDFNIPLLLPLSAGVIIGIVASARVIGFLLARYPQMTYAAILGLVVGSVLPLYPGYTAADGVLPFVAMLLGILLIIIFDKVGKKFATQKESQ